MSRSPSFFVLLLVLNGAVVVSGCGASSRARPTVAVRDVATSTLATRFEALRVHSRDVEERLALAEAETRELREQLRSADLETRRRTVRIGEGRGGAEESLRAAHNEGAGLVDVEVAVPAPEDAGRPVLRLVGQPDALSVRGAPLPPMAPLALPPVPAGVETRLPVMAIPGADPPGRYARQLAERVGAPPASRSPSSPSDLPQLGSPAESPPSSSASAGASASDSVDGATVDYRAALELVHTRHLEQALAALTVFLERHPGHVHAEGARYWRGEVHYAQRDYATALAEFEELVRLVPQGRKTADALLKIGLCHRRMGDLARAHLFFQRVLRQFPDTEAARSASRQDAS